MKRNLEYCLQYPTSHAKGKWHKVNILLKNNGWVVQYRPLKGLSSMMGNYHVQFLNLPGLSLHQLTGDRSDIWSVIVSGNWRVTFRMNCEDVEIVNYEDYH